MSVHRAIASKSDDERKAVAGMGDDERKAFSSKGAYLSVTHAKRSLEDEEQRSSLIVHHDCSSRSQAFIHARAGEHFAFIAAPHSIENVLRVLRSSMLPLCSLARERLALIVAHSCNSLALTLR